MTEWISKASVMRIIDESPVYTDVLNAKTYMAEQVENLPVRKEEAQPHGVWTEEFDESANPFFKRRWRCSACNDYNYYGRPDFCPCCGAEMREGDAE